MCLFLSAAKQSATLHNKRSPTSMEVFAPANLNDFDVLVKNPHLRFENDLPPENSLSGAANKCICTRLNTKHNKMLCTKNDGRLSGSASLV